jgi:cell wall-associated NlpC family hydrolase
MKTLSTKVLPVIIFAFALCIGLHLNGYEAKADVQTDSQQGVVLKSTNILAQKIIKVPKKEVAATNSNENTYTKSSSDRKSAIKLSRGGTVVSGSKYSVVSKAFEFLGRPYVWGASGPSAFDCSGFTSYVYKSFGVSLPHKASQQASIGQTVSRSSLQAGDLVFFDTEGGISHVGIYIGDGQFIHASSGSDKVTVSEIGSSYYSGRYITAKRILN